MTKSRKAGRIWIAAAAAALALALAPQALAAELAATPTTAQASIAQAEVTLQKATYYHTGKAVKPYPAVTLAGKRLTAGRDYDVTYKANTSVGTARVTVTGKGLYSGSKTARFKIAYSIGAVKAAKVKQATYTGKAHKPKPSLTYKGKKLSPKNYRLSYAKNVNAGTATITVAGRGSYAGTKKVRFRIAKASLAAAKVSAIPKQKYTGKAVKPKVKAKLAKRSLSAGRDYKLSYSGNKSFGTARVTLTGKGNYKGAVSAKFTIAQPEVEYQGWVRILGIRGTKACFLESDPETVYVGVDEPPKVAFPKALKVWDGSYQTSTNWRTGKVTRIKQYTVLRCAYVADHSRGTTITMPAGLAEKLWKSKGPAFEKLPVDYESLWLGIFSEAGMSLSDPTYITRFNKRFGIDVPEWFSRAIHDAYMTSPGAAHTQPLEDYVLA